MDHCAPDAFRFQAMPVTIITVECDSPAGHKATLRSGCLYTTGDVAS
jgi:hypothetical protein